MRKVASFNQQPDFWFRSRVTQKHAPLPGKVALGFAHQLHHGRQFLQRRLAFHPQIPLRLRILFQATLQLAQRLPTFFHDSQNLKRADDAVAGGGEVAKNHVAALLAADVEIARHHFFEHITVAYFGANDFAAVRSQSFVEAKIAHDRRNQGIVAQFFRSQ